MSQVWRRLEGRLPYLRRRGLMLAATRAFFQARGYWEVETPYAVVAPGEEVHLRAFRVEPGGLWLHTSPEFAMKRLLAGGVPKIFQLARVWRDEVVSDTHLPEFTMLEWYGVGMGLEDLVAEVRAYLAVVLPVVVAGGVDMGAVERLTVAEAFWRYVGVDVLSTAGDAGALAAGAGVVLRDGEGWEDLFFRLLLERIEPVIGRSAPCFLTHWPAALAALARRDPFDGRVAERFEVYMGGVEVGNGFVELTDAVEQRARFLEDRARRAALGGQDWPMDEGFLEAVGQLPACAGIAVGFDRLVMLATGAPRLQDVTWLGG